MDIQAKIDRYKELYKESLASGNPIADEANDLFQDILAYYGDDPSKMDALHEEIRNEFYGPEVTLEDRIVILEEKVAKIEEHLNLGD